MAVPARDKLSIRLDWVNIPYRTVYLAGGGVLLVVVGLLLAISFREPIADLLSRARKDARTEITEAQRLLSEASAYARDSRSVILRDNASTKLDEARGKYTQRDYQDARTSAIMAQNYAQKVIDMGRGESATDREVRFYKIEGEVRVKRAGEFRWEDATTRMALRIGDQIKTGARAGAQIIYFDGTITTVRAESLLEIKDLYEEPTTKQRRVQERLNWGEMETTVRKGNVAGSFHEVQSDAVTAKTSADAEFRIAYNRANEQGTVTLNAGQIEVASGEKQVKMSSGEMVSVDKGVMGSVEKLPAAPRLLVPSDQKIFVYTTPKDASTTLAWEKVPEASSYHLQLSERSLFGDLLLDKKDVRTSTVELPGLPASSYYWRVATLDAAGHTSAFTAGRKFRITTGEELRDQNDKSPPLLVIQDFILNGAIVILNGKTEAGTTVWVEGERIDVDEMGIFQAVVKLKNEGVNTVKVVAQDPAGNESRKSLEAFVEGF